MEKLCGTQKADVAIAGAGLSGLTTALWLSRAGLRVAVLEARKAGSGISSYCLGAAYTDEKQLPAAEQAMDAVRKLTEPYGLWQPVSVYRQDMKADGGMLASKRYLQLLIWLARKNGVCIYEYSRVTDMEANEFYTEQGTLRAPYLIVTTGYPILNIPGWFFLYLDQYEYDSTFLSGSEISAIYLNDSEKTMLIPWHGGAFLRYCSGRVGDKANARRAEDSLQCVQKKNNVFREGAWVVAPEVHTPDGLPIIGAYGRKTPDLLVAAGYGGKGIVGSMIAAQAITGHVLGLPGEIYEIYSPRRFATEWFSPFQGIWRYIKSGITHPRAPKCPHMRCSLVYNPRTRLWECPCHGSRFDDIGHVENTPAVHEAILRSRK